jgi:hypothetical protein
MNEMKGETRDIFFIENKDHPGKERYLTLLIVALLIYLSHWALLLAREHFSDEIYQIFISCIIASIIIASGVIGCEVEFQKPIGLSCKVSTSTDSWRRQLHTSHATSC